MNGTSAEQDGRYALRGIRVVDFTWVHAGPAATRVLADQGAEVIKVESEFAMTVTGGPSPRTPRGWGQRHNWNAGKLSVSLNMRTPQGIAIAKRLVAVSDVVAENFSGRVMPKWRMDYESLRRITPDLIMLSMSGLGRTGPWKEYVSYGQTLQAWSGFSYLTGFPDTDPCGPASAYSDAVAAMAGAQSVLLALIHRVRTGQGQWIDLSQFEALSSCLETLVLDLDVNGNGREVQRAGNRPTHGVGAPHGAYRCKGDDRWVAIAVSTNEEWQALARSVGDQSWTNHERFATVSGRHLHADELDRLVESWTVEHGAEEVMHLLQAVGVPAGVVQTGADLAERDPQIKERGVLVRAPDHQGNLRTIEGVPYKLSRTPGGPKRVSPSFGEHQTYVLQGILGMSDEELEECAIAGAFE